jgi:hypothetical protein
MAVNERRRQFFSNATGMSSKQQMNTGAQNGALIFMSVSIHIYACRDAVAPDVNPVEPAKVRSWFEQYAGTGAFAVCQYSSEKCCLVCR